MKTPNMKHKVNEPSAQDPVAPVSLSAAGLRAPSAQKKIGLFASFLSGSAFNNPREFFGSRLVCTVVSSRARGLSIGVNLNPDQHCNFDCEHCEKGRQPLPPERFLDVGRMTNDLEQVLELAHSSEMQNLCQYQNVPADLLQLRHVALSGDGEPTFCPNFLEALQAVIHIRARRQFPFFKIVLMTNAAGLHLPAVQRGLKLLTAQDEIWAELGAGTQDYLDRVKHPDCPLKKILENILLVARQRPVIIQSLFPLLDHEEPPAEEIQQYALRLRDLKTAGAQIPLVQIYSATLPTVHSRCGYLPLKTLAEIARTVRAVSGLKAEVF